MNRLDVPLVYALVSLVAHVVVIAFAAYLVRRRKDATARRGLVRVIGWAGVILWTAGGAMWSNLGRTYPRVATVLLPEWLTAWPAHETALAVSGLGLGANARTPLVLTLVCAIAWAIVLWSPFLTMRWRIMSVRTAVAIELLVLAAVALGFWKFGNG